MFAICSLTPTSISPPSLPDIHEPPLSAIAPDMWKFNRLSRNHAISTSVKFCVHPQHREQCCTAITLKKGQCMNAERTPRTEVMILSYCLSDVFNSYSAICCWYSFLILNSCTAPSLMYWLCSVSK